MDKMPGARFWLPLHPVCAQYKTLISDIYCDLFPLCAQYKTLISDIHCDLFPLCVLTMVSYNEMVRNC